MHKLQRQGRCSVHMQGTPEVRLHSAKPHQPLAEPGCAGECAQASAGSLLGMVVSLFACLPGSPSSSVSMGER